MDISKPLRRRMKVRKTGNEWSWITFKYENVPTFCFICGIIGHADKFCSKLFDVPENEITRPYGAGLRAQLRRQNNMIGSKWLRSGDDSMADSADSAGDGRSSIPVKDFQTEPLVPEKSGRDKDSQYSGGNLQQKDMIGNKSGNSKVGGTGIGGKNNTGVKNIILDNKKRRTDCEGEEIMGINTEIEQESENEIMDKDGINNGPKNRFAAGSEIRARQGL